MYHEEINIIDLLVEQLNIIKELVNIPWSTNNSSQDCNIDFLAGNNSLQNNCTFMVFINNINRILWD